MKRGTKMDKRWRTELWICTAAILLLLAGCQNADPANGGNDGANVVAEEVTLDGPQKSYLEDNNDNANGSDAPSGGENRLDDNSSAETSSLKKGADGKSSGSAKGDKNEWNKKLPALHGIAIGDRATAVSSLLGKELDSYVLEEETSRIQVHEYKGLSVGFNQKGAVHFVEVYGTDAVAGLNGLMIGDNPEAALKKLGKPESQTEYLLTYEAQGAMLKLDIDPGMNEIVSMKLIAVS